MAAGVEIRQANRSYKLCVSSVFDLQVILLEPALRLFVDINPSVLRKNAGNGNRKLLQIVLHCPVRDRLDQRHPRASCGPRVSPAILSTINKAAIPFIFPECYIA